MSNPFVAEIRIFPFNFAPVGWAFCDGQLMPILQNTALFSLLGTTYGGDGRSTFALPDLQGCAPMQQGQGSGLSLYDLGETGGTDIVTLLDSEIPSHNHALQASTSPADGPVATGAANSRVSGATPYLPPAGAPLVPMAFNALSVAGSTLPHNNLQPYLALSFCIALQGVFPARP
jgi:microcystin-dependent protein